MTATQSSPCLDTAVSRIGAFMRALLFGVYIEAPDFVSIPQGIPLSPRSTASGFAHAPAAGAGSRPVTGKGPNGGCSKLGALMATLSQHFVGLGLYVLQVTFHKGPYGFQKVLYTAGLCMGDFLHQRPFWRVHSAVQGLLAVPLPCTLGC